MDINDNQESKAVLALEDGTVFYGRTSGSKRTVCGEIIFNTSMTGYQEICTDPSYADQIVLFTTSHIGNVGVNGEDDESSQPWIKGIITREMSRTSSNWRSEKSFTSFLNDHQVTWIEGIDTRKLTRHLRNHGTKNGCIMVGECDIDLAIELARSYIPHSAENFAIPSSVYKKDAPRIVVYDFGVKSSILRMLTCLGCEVIVVPSHASAAQLLAYIPDGIILSNGPGDPSAFGERIKEIRELIFSKVPVLGICLGCQLIAIAAGGSTKKMKFGHHGANHPVYDIEKKKAYITSQNHNFVVDEASLPIEFEVTHVSVFDGSVQGIRSKNYPVMGFQGHPEGSPGPQDMGEVFEVFLKNIDLKKCH
jgi:carbamoyl-phosphate synthase small subunit